MTLTAGKLKQLDPFLGHFGLSKCRQFAARLVEMSLLGTHYQEVDEYEVALYWYALSVAPMTKDVKYVVDQEQSLVNKDGLPFTTMLGGILVNPKFIQEKVKYIMIHRNKAIIQREDGTEEIYSNGKDKDNDVPEAFPKSFIMAIAKALEPEEVEYTWG